ncbi:MAG: hypothetical protein JSV34_03065 [Candidatus Omnitrophota bacterium]|nr:MAG: hypothetical protein JSV34_03065 [Candidatus Omnitrophota bacterium]
MLCNNYKDMVRRLLIIAGAFCLVLAPVSAFALQVNKSSIKAQMPANQTYHGTIEVENPSEAETAVRVYLADFVYLAPFNGEKEFYPPDSTKFSLSKNIKFSPQEFTIPPFSNQVVNFTISSDQEFEHVKCGVIFFETSLGAAYQDGKLIDVVGRIGTLIFVASPSNTKKASFKNIKGGEYKLKGVLKNIGETFLHASGTFFVMDNEGMVEDRDEIRESYLLPQDEVQISIELSKTLSADNYIMIITYDLEDGDVSVKEIDFSLSSSGEVNILEVRD